MATFVLTKLWDDPEIGGRIFLQAKELLQGGLIAKDRMDAAWEVLFLCMHKLTSVKYHRDNYLRIHKKEIEQLYRMLKRQNVEVPARKEQFKLIAELEAFLVQLKSSLDILVKLLIPLAGLSYGAVATFGDKGERIIKKLTRRPIPNVEPEKVEALVRLIRSDNQTWLEKVIDLRDRVNHSAGFQNLVFNPRRLPNGNYIIEKPTIGGLDVPEFLAIVYRNCLEFHQDFVSLAMNLYLPKGILMAEQPDKNMFIMKYGTESARYIKWGLRVPIAAQQQGG